MAKVVYGGSSYDISESTSLLDGLLSYGVNMPHGCRGGICQSCLLKCIEGDVPPESQRGLRPAQLLNHELLACQCYTTSDLTVTLPLLAEHLVSATVSQLRLLSSDILEVQLETKDALQYRAGQFIKLQHPEGIARCYSLASTPIEPYLRIHVREYPNGHVSSWVHHQLKVGDEVAITTALGECFYIPGHPDQPILLIGTGSGIAPLLGILSDAIQQGHTGELHLYHGARKEEGLYLDADLHEMASVTDRMTYTGCISGTTGDPPSRVKRGRASEIALNEHSNLKGWRVYLCGNPEMVRSAQMQAYLAGAALTEIHADPFNTQ